MPLRPDMEPQDYFKIFLRRKWLITFALLTVILGAVVYCVVANELYKSTTTILVIPQRVPENYIRSTITLRIEDRIETIQQQVMSRTRLSTVMEELGLFREERKNLPIESVIESMRKRIEIQVRGNENPRRRDGGNESFSLSFVHEDPRLAMLTTSRLASFFIDENLKTREQQAVGTSEFLESQLQETKARLEAQEEKVKQYKLHFMGELPEQLQVNLSMLTRLQEQYRTNGESLRSAEDRKVFLDAQLGMIERSIQGGGTVTGDGGIAATGLVTDPIMRRQAELAARRTRLAELSAKYTDKYPDIPRLRQEIRLLEQELADARGSTLREDSQGGSGGGASVQGVQPSDRDLDEIRRLKAHIIAVEREIGSLKKERTDVQASISNIQEKVERSPRREQEMVSLTRDYNNLRQSYDDLLQKKLEADIAQELEKRQKGEQFQVLDPANLPESSFSPNRKMALGLGLLIALSAAFGGAIGMEYFDPTLREGKHFKHFFDLPILASIPVIKDADYVRRKARYRYYVIGGLLTYGVGFAAFVVLYVDKIRSIVRF